MSKPSRNTDTRQILSSSRTFFVTTKTSMARALLQSERNALLFVDVLRSCVREREFTLHDFVVMPDHVHLLITISGEMTIEKTMQLIKGRFSYRVKKEHGYQGEVWQRGFWELRVEDEASFARHQEYIAQNPVRRGLVDRANDFPFCFEYLARQKAAGAKAP